MYLILLLHIDTTESISLNFKYPIGEFNALKDGTAYGEYLNRYLSHIKLLKLIDTHSTSHDMDTDLGNDFSLYLHRPLGSTVLAMQVVAFEEYLRNIFFAIKNVDNIENYFEKINDVKPGNFGDYFNIRNSSNINLVFEKTLSVRPIEESRVSILDDLAVIRDIVFHYWGIAIKRKVDQLKSKRYKIVPESEICMSYVDLTKECEYIREIVSEINQTIYKGVIGKVVNQLDSHWDINMPEILSSLLSIFGYLGHIFTSEYTAGKPQAEIKKMYIDACISDIKSWK